MKLQKFTRQLMSNVLAQLQEASLPLGEAVHESESKFRISANGFELRFNCYPGDGGRRYHCLVDMARLDGRVTTYSLVTRKSNATGNPEVEDALKTRFTFAELVGS